MATAAPEIKPDFNAPKRHFCFTDEHEALRESIESFCRKELAPHSEEWERDGFPDWVFKRMGELGFLGIYFPEEYGGQGGDYFMSIVRGEAMAQSNNGGLAMGIAVHTDMATPPILKFGSEYLKQTYLVPSIKGEKISSLGISEPGAGSDVAGIRTRAIRDGDEYVINGS
jgi:alkylation response protein AidB-like acyl-CoA dehydrogenase